MISIRFVPERAPVVRRERLYSAVCARGGVYTPLGLKVRARSAAHAEEKVLFCFRRELRGKTLDFSLEAMEGDGDRTPGPGGNGPDKLKKEVQDGEQLEHEGV